MEDTPNLCMVVSHCYWWEKVAERASITRAERSIATDASMLSADDMPGHWTTGQWLDHKISGCGS
eukprot:2328637-Amphidinium_carterae.1